VDIFAVKNSCSLVKKAYVVVALLVTSFQVPCIRRPLHHKSVFTCACLLYDRLCSITNSAIAHTVRARTYR
jgi:hypothetical protein